MGHIAAICDKDTIIAISSPHRRDIAIGSPLAVDKPIHDDVEAVMQMREKLNRSTANGDAMIGITQNDEQGRAYTAQLIIPILAAGDAVMLLSKEPGAVISPTDVKVAETAANFMGKQLEN